MVAILNILTVIMAHALQWKDGCRLFALIQTVQLLEIGPMRGFADAQWMFSDQANIGIEIAAVLSTKQLRLARSLMVAHAFLKCLRYMPIDCPFELVRGGLYWTIWALNIAIILTLLAYAFPKPIFRFKEQYARRSGRPARTPTTATTSTAA